jgi:GH24 family phage-related lysozyme (muramidase)
MTPPIPAPRQFVSPRGLSLIRTFEAFRGDLYYCPAGKPTIGYGHVLRECDGLKPPITEAQADLLLRKDLAPIEIYLSAVFPDVNQNEFDALASFCFNVGLGAFERSTLFKLLKAGDRIAAARQFSAWVKAGSQVLAGLKARRAAEKVLFLT